VLRELIEKFIVGSLYSTYLYKPGKLEDLKKLTDNLVKIEKEREVLYTKLVLEREQLLALFNSINEPLHVSNLETNEILFANDSFKSLIGIDPIGKKCYELICNNPCNKQVRNVFYSEKFNKWFKCVNKVIDWPQESDSIKAMFELLIDITDAHTLQLQLAEREAKFKSLVSLLGDYVWQIDEKGYFNYVSGNSNDIWGYCPAEITGRHIEDFLQDTHRDRSFSELLKTYEPIKEYKGIGARKDGSVTIVETSAVPIYDTSGVFKGYLGVDKDITEKEQLKKAIETLHDLAWRINRTNSLHEALTYAVDSAQELLKADIGEYYLIDKDTDTLNLIYCRGATDDEVTNTRSYNAGNIKHSIVKQGKLVYIADTDHVLDTYMRTLVIVPINNGDIVGCFCLGYREPRNVPSYLLQTLESLGKLLSIVINRLHKETDSDYKCLGGSEC